MSWRFAAFYTEDTPYEEEVHKLQDSARKLALPITITGVPSKGKWELNCGIKPQFILTCLEAFPDDDIVYVDADARIMQYPAIFDTLDCDIAVHYREGTELLSGTIFIKNNERVKRLIADWIIAQQASPLMWDQKVLQQLLDDNPDLNVAELPATYCQIFDIMKDAGDPVILHTQASRINRKKVEVIPEPEDCIVQPIIDNVRVRWNEDGSFWLARCKKNVQADLDAQYIRFPGHLRWFPITSNSMTINDFKFYFHEPKAYIVGKGPSLDKLTASDFDDPFAPILAINESIHKVESLDLPNPVFMVQQDLKLQETCKPKRGGVWLSHGCRDLYQDQGQRLVFNIFQFSLYPGVLTVLVCIKLAQHLGVTHLELLCFDGCVNQVGGYAKCVGHDASVGGDPDRFLSHRPKIEAASEGIDVKWIIPTGPAGKASYKLQL